MSLVLVFGCSLLKCADEGSGDVMVTAWGTAAEASKPPAAPSPPAASALIQTARLHKGLIHLFNVIKGIE